MSITVEQKAWKVFPGRLEVFLFYYLYKKKTYKVVQLKSSEYFRTLQNFSTDLICHK